MSRGPPTDYERMAARYDEGRALPAAALEAWMSAVAPFVLPPTGPVVLDVGAGTGVFAAAWAQHFGAFVVALDPSPAMLRRAIDSRSAPGIRYARAEGERLPLRDRTCDVAWLSTVVHHIGDLEACARELRRVLRGAGRVLIRNAFSGRTDGITWLRFWPAARPLAQRRWPEADAVIACFEAAGFRVVALRPVRQQTAPDLATYCARVRVRADSALAMIDDADFEAGLRRLQRAAAREPPRPVCDTLDLLVLE